MPNGQVFWTAHAIKLNVIEIALTKCALITAFENALDFRLARCAFIHKNTDKNLLGHLCFDAVEMLQILPGFLFFFFLKVIMLLNNMISISLLLQCFVFGFVVFLL